MDIHNLVHMANRIGEFFDALPDAEEAKEGIAEHLRRYWEPRMRRALLGHLTQGGGGLLPLVREALEAHRDSLQPAQTA